MLLTSDYISNCGNFECNCPSSVPSVSQNKAIIDSCISFSLASRGSQTSVLPAASTQTGSVGALDKLCHSVQCYVMHCESLRDVGCSPHRCSSRSQGKTKYTQKNSESSTNPPLTYILKTLRITVFN